MSRAADLAAAERLVRSGCSLADASKATGIPRSTLAKHSAAKSWFSERPAEAKIPTEGRALSDEIAIEIRAAIAEGRVPIPALAQLHTWAVAEEIRQAAMAPKVVLAETLTPEQIDEYYRCLDRIDEIMGEAPSPSTGVSYRELVDDAEHRFRATLAERHEAQREAAELRERLMRATDTSRAEADRAALVAQLAEAREDLVLARMERDAARDDAEGLRRTIEAGLT